MNQQTKTTQWRFPAEWEMHRACLLARPAAKDLWGENLEQAQKQFDEFRKALAPEEVIELSECGIPYGDIWLRDIAPLFVKNAQGDLAGVQFQLNGWGGKYVLEHDDQVACRVLDFMKVQKLPQKLILEGGAIDVDGQGTALTTKQCLLNPNRNPGASASDIEGVLFASLGIQKVIWLNEGLANDHTDGHVDNIARFVGPGKVICMEPSSENDPNREVLLEIKRDLEAATDVFGQKLEVIAIPSPGLSIPASYLNFYIGNQTVVVPVYGQSGDREAVDVISKLFPGRRVIGLASDVILTGGGSFHCISQQVPL